MKTIENEAFGTICHNLYWSKQQPVFWNGKRLDVTVIIDGLEKDCPTESQQKAFSLFLKRQDHFFSAAVSSLLPFCRRNYEQLLTEADLYSRLVPHQLVFQRQGSWGITFDCPWENEMRLSVLFKDDGIIAGMDDMLL